MAGAALSLGLAMPATAGPPAPLSALFVEGDSLTVGSSNAIKAHLSGDFRTITVDAEVGRSTPTGIARLNAGQSANVWVLALGTNDAPDPKTMRRNVKTVLARAGDRPVLWVSVWRAPEYGRVNRMLSRLDRKFTQLSVLRWDKFIKANPQYLAADRVHLTPAGYEVRGKMIADAVRALLGSQ
jgi:lysophospholipase L1-like esterase